MTRLNIGVLVFLLGCVLLLGFAVRKQRGQIDSLLASGFQFQQEAAQGDYIYISSMHPWITSDRPGTCPICGMELVKVSGEDARKMQEAVQSGVVQVSASPVKRVLANVELAKVQELSFRETMPVDGTVVTPTDALNTVPSWVAGRIDRLFVERSGDFISKGQKLMEIYSPTLVQAQEEYLTALKTKDRMNTAGYGDLTENTESLITSAKRKLELLGLTEEQIKAVAETGKTVDSLTVYARTGGLVMSVFAAEGMYVREGQAILELARLDPIWVEMEVYQEDAGRVRIGDAVQFHPLGEPNRTLTGSIFEFAPTLTPDKRTLIARARVGNPGYRLRPGLFVDGEVVRRKDETVLVVPRDAVLITGRGARAWVPSIDVSDQFEPRDVEVGRILGDDREFYEVLSGLRKGQTVVQGAVFLLDSEAQLLISDGSAAKDDAQEGSSTDATDPAHAT